MNLPWYHVVFQEAAKAVGLSEPNPPVGAAIVHPHRPKILAAGFTGAPGDLHAEARAISNAKDQGTSLAGARMWVSLEPCSHFGRTPPCASLIAESEISEVHIAVRDPNPEAAGGMNFLAENNVKTTVLSRQQLYPEFTEEMAWTLEPFLYSVQNSSAAMTLKWAQDADGNLAPAVGSSGSITSDVARGLMHHFRILHRVVIGSPGSVRWDMPGLNPRIERPLLWKNVSDFMKIMIEAAYERKQTPVKRVLWLPATNFDSEKWEALLRKQNQIDGGENLYVICPEEAQSQNKLLWDVMGYPASHWFSLTAEGSLGSQIQRIKQIVLHLGSNRFMIEAGPSLSESLTRHKIAEYLLVFASQTKSKFGENARGCEMAAFIARNPMLEPGARAFGYELVARHEIKNESVLFWRRADLLDAILIPPAHKKER